MTETIADHLTLEQAGRVAVVTVNRPEARNAMTFPMYEGLHDLCERLDADPAVRVIILRGAGDKAFVSGTDIRQFQTFTTKEDALGYEARISRVLNRLAGMRKKAGSGRLSAAPAPAALLGPRGRDR
jgi:enoyl-CoA hydratase/carnithine racemase